MPAGLPRATDPASDRAARPLPVGVAEESLVELAGGLAGEPVEYLHAPGHLVPRQVLAAVRLEVGEQRLGVDHIAFPTWEPVGSLAAGAGAEVADDEAAPDEHPVDTPRLRVVEEPGED